MTAENIKTVCIIGAGFMGTQLGLQCAIHGYNVNINDVSPESLEKSAKTTQQILEKMASKLPLDKKSVLDKIRHSTNLEESASKADIAIESISEKLDLKRKVFSSLDDICPPHTIIATGASVFKVSSLEDATKRPDKVLNMHFYPPIWERPVVELMRGSKTSDETIETAMQFSKNIGLVPFLIKKEISGFLFNRVWHAIKRECLFLVDGGYASFEDIDRTWMLNTGMKVGPFGTMDMVGLDVIYNVSMAYYMESGDDRDKPSRTLVEKIERNELGMKTGIGFYSYPNPNFQDPNWIKGN